MKRRHTWRRYIHGVGTDKEREHIRKRHLESGEIKEEWGYTWRMGTYGKGIHIK